MLFTEYNEEAHMKHIKESSFEDGMDVMSELYNKLKELGRLNDFDKAMSDPKLRRQLVMEFFPEDNKIV